MKPAATRGRAPSEPVRVGLVGCGAVAELYHLPALLASPEVELVAFVDPFLDRARALARRAHGAFALATHEELPGRVDLAIIAAPNALHASISTGLLDAGVHVLVEKPMARSVAECEAMLAAAERGGAVLAVGHDFRYFPIARFAREFLQAGLLGEIRRVDVRQSTGSGWPAVTTDILSPAAGGGALINFGIHNLDLLGWWLGELNVLRYRDDAAGGLEAECECELMLANGAPLTMELSSLRGLRDTTLVEGDRGTIEIGIHEPATFRIRLQPGGPILAGSVPDTEVQRAPLRTVFSRQLADLLAAIRTGATPLVDGIQGMRAVALVERCYAIREPLRRPWDYPEAYASAAERG